MGNENGRRRERATGRMLHDYVEAGQPQRAFAGPVSTGVSRPSWPHSAHDPS